MTDQKFLDKLNGKLAELFDLYPIDDLRPSEVTEDMKDGLFKAYGHKGFRLYLENAIKIAIRNMGLASTPVEIAYYKSRIDVLEQLLTKGKQLFTEMNVKRDMRKVVKTDARKA